MPRTLHMTQELVAGLSDTDPRVAFEFTMDMGR